MKIFIGLGNIGEKYDGTRHNVGKDFLIWLARKKDFSDFSYNKYFDAEISNGNLGGEEIEIVLPKTYMNNSGESISKYFKDKEFDPKEVYVFHDDVDINFGQVKVTSGPSGSGGHNGIKSLRDHLGRNDFNRIKFGIIPKRFFVGFKKPSKEEISNFVLKKFSKSEQSKLTEIFQKALDLL